MALFRSDINHSRIVYGLFFVSHYPFLYNGSDDFDYLWEEQQWKV